MLGLAVSFPKQQDCSVKLYSFASENETDWRVVKLGRRFLSGTLHFTTWNFFSGNKPVVIGSFVYGHFAAISLNPSFKNFSNGSMIFLEMDSDNYSLTKNKKKKPVNSFISHS